MEYRDTMTKEEMKKWLENYVGPGEVYKYLTAEWGEMLRIYPSGKVHVGTDQCFGEINGEKPISSVRCLGGGTMGMSCYCVLMYSCETEQVERLQQQFLDNWLFWQEDKDNKDSSPGDIKDNN